MARMKFLCDADRCIECNACVTACKNENEVPWGINRRRVVTLNDGKQHPYGYGWELNPLGGRKAVRHGGSLTGFRASFVRLVDDKLSIVVLANCSTAAPGVIANEVARRYVPELAAEPAASGN